MAYLVTALTRTKAQRESLQVLFPQGLEQLQVTVQTGPVRVVASLAGSGALTGRAGAAVIGTKDLVPGERVPDVSEWSAVGAAATVIRRDTPEFERLVRNENTEIVFKDEEGTGADRMMTPTLKARLDDLAARVASEWAGTKLRVTEAWDEDMEHSPNSVHYEGRGADLTTWPRDPGKLGRLARLAVEAGLEWVFYEDGLHIHVSVSR